MKQMYYLSAVLTFLLIGCTNAQETSIANFNLDYYPEKKIEVREDAYKRAINTLKQAYASARENDSTFNHVDHYNMFGAFMTLLEPKDLVHFHFERALEKNPETISAVFLSMYKTYEGRIQNYYSKEEYDSITTRLTIIKESHKEEEFDFKSYANEGGYSVQLVELMSKLIEDDQKYRSEHNWAKQNVLDSINQKLVDSLYHQYDCYIGRSLVGERLEYVMWAVIQHADIEKQEFYLPIVHQAVKNNELKQGPLKMLIDRVYSKKYGYQIFGSQGEVNLGTDVEISEAKERFNLN